MRFRGQFSDGVDQLVKLARVNVTVFQDIQACDLKLLETGQGGVHRVGVIRHDLFAQVAQHLEQDNGDHGFAHTAFALLDEMNGCHRLTPFWLNGFFGVHVPWIGKLVAGRRDMARPG